MAKVPKLRTLFDNYMKENLKTKKAAVLLSSGLDALTAALTAHDMGVKIHAFTFQMGDNQSFDSKHAEIVARKMGWDFTLVKVPTDVETIAAYWPILRKHFDCRKKRDYECAYPMLFCFEAIKAAGYKQVITGFAADAHFCFARNTHIQCISGPKSEKPKFVEYRKEYFKEWFKTGLDGLNSENNPSAMYQITQICKKHKIQHLNPWMSKPVFDYFIKFSWQELNMPKQKQHVVAAFQEHIDLVGHRPHRGYQTEAKVPAFFEQLLAVESINFNGRKRIMDVARDWSTL